MSTNDCRQTGDEEDPGDVVMGAEDAAAVVNGETFEGQLHGGVLSRFIKGPQKLRRVWRYAMTSVVATAVSEVTLLIVYGTGALGASSSAVAASLAGTFPSYAMTRYCIWPEADRHHFGRQATSFWLVAITSLMLSSVVTGLAADLAPAGRAAHLAVVALAYIGTYGALWLAKFALYQGILFRPAQGPTEIPVTGKQARSLAEQRDETGR
jgi:putative flippase GtrA